MKFLFTGASGFVGRQLWATGFFPAARWLCRSACPEESHTTAISQYSFSELQPYLREADVVVHLAAVTRDSRWAILNNANVLLTKNLSEWSQSVNPKIRLISLSSDLAGCLSSPYGRSKHEAENFLSKTGGDRVSLRASMIAGERIQGPASSLLTLKRLSRLPIVPILGNGRFIIRPLWIHDFAEIIVRLGTRRGIAEDCGIWSFSGDAVSYKDLIDYWRRESAQLSVCVPFPIGLLSGIGNLLRRFNPATTFPVDFLESIIASDQNPPPDIFDHLKVRKTPWRIVADKI